MQVAAVGELVGGVDGDLWLGVCEVAGGEENAGVGFVVSGLHLGVDGAELEEDAFEAGEFDEGFRGPAVVSGPNFVVVDFDGIVVRHRPVAFRDGVP